MRFIINQKKPFAEQMAFFCLFFIEKLVFGNLNYYYYNLDFSHI
ncbi:Uncharacterized protein dnl_28490 [Desulfonema limicola]|uniref:Uncharacterized protein n=1 Tax=Desulfonema limicola TaxID=45656 RepID=A0A975B881_9BACT|nr:Uncharacterized protein dnl_28490 [Desulfonema limicola]